MNSIGNRVQEIRKAQRLTQSQFAEEMAISQAHVSKIEKGAERPSPTLARLMALKYNVDEEWLNNGIGREPLCPNTSEDNVILAKQVSRLEGQLARSHAGDVALILGALDNLVMILTVPNGFSDAQLTEAAKHKYFVFVRKAMICMWKVIASVTLNKPLLPSSSAKEWLSFKSGSEKMLDDMSSSTKNAANVFLTALDDVFRL